MNSEFLNLNDKCKTLPNSPGVYLMKNEVGEIIYIGKAKNLKNRVSSYFLFLHEKDSKVEKMVENVKNFEYIITDNEFEALVLECSLIKKYQPKYNILLKDAKGYSYIKITDELWPRISYVKQKADDGSTYIGPYMSSSVLRETLEEILKVFKLPDCMRDLRKVYKRPCLNYYIKRCSAPCIRAITHDEYISTINEVKNFLKNGIKDTLSLLKKQMKEASEKMEFEAAAKIRDKIILIKRIKDKQKVVSANAESQDVIAIAKSECDFSVQIFRFTGGNLYESKNFILNTPQDEAKVRTEFLKQFYGAADYIPKKIILDGKIEDKELIKKFISDKREKSVKLETPKKGESLKLIKMCKNNAYENLLRESGLKTKEDFYLQDLKNILSLEKFPQRIEAYDISNLFGSNCVAGMVVFKDGKCFKRDYRIFNLGYMQDDFKAMKTVIKRRFENKSDDTSFSQIPDLILVDGGYGQVTAARNAAKELGIKVSIFGMVKDKKHRTRAITDEKSEIKIKNNGRLFLFITSVQNEVHRYTINYHRKLRKKEMKTSELTHINGVGKVRSKILLKTFGDIESISKASFEEINSIKGISSSCAKEIYDYFHSGKD